MQNTGARLKLVTYTHGCTTGSVGWPQAVFLAPGFSSVLPAVGEESFLRPPVQLSLLAPCLYLPTYTYHQFLLFSVVSLLSAESHWNAYSFPWLSIQLRACLLLLAQPFLVCRQSGFSLYTTRILRAPPWRQSQLWSVQFLVSFTAPALFQRQPD